MDSSDEPINKDGEGRTFVVNPPLIFDGWLVSILCHPCHNIIALAACRRVITKSPRSNAACLAQMIKDLALGHYLMCAGGKCRPGGYVSNSRMNGMVFLPRNANISESSRARRSDDPYGRPSNQAVATESATGQARRDFCYRRPESSALE